MTKALALDESQYGIGISWLVSSTKWAESLLAGGSVCSRLPLISLPSPSIFPGNIWTPPWDELVISTPDPKATQSTWAWGPDPGSIGCGSQLGAPGDLYSSLLRP